MPVPELETALTPWQRISKFLQPKTSPARVPELTANVGNFAIGGFAVVTQDAALVRQGGADTYRAWAQTPWVFSAINILKNQVAAAEWDIVPYDNTKRYPARTRDRIKDLLDQPSVKLDSFQSFISTVIDDLLTLDSGIFEKVRYPNGELAELWPVRGEWIAVDERWDGSDPDRPRYYFVPDGTVRAAFRNDDMVYMIANQRANSAVGLPPPAILHSVIESELQALGYNRRQVMGAAPDGVFNIGESAAPEEVQKVKGQFQAEVFGQGAMAVIGGYKAPSWMPFRSSNRDMQFREWQDLLIRCIAIVYGLAPMDLGITFDVNRSSAEQQADNSDDRGSRPLLSRVQNYLTREVVWDRSFGGKANNLQFVFKSLNLSETKTKAEINRVAMPGVPWKSINDARITDGRPPIGDPADEDNFANHLLTLSPKGMLDLTTGKYIGEEQLAELQQETQAAKAESAPSVPGKSASGTPTASA